MSKIIGLVGFIGSGKGTVASTLVESYEFKQDSFASTLKDACAVIFDWPRAMLEGDTGESRAWREEVDQWWSDSLGIPGFSPRLALQLVGTDAIRNHFNEGIWLMSMANRIRKNSGQNVVVSDTRFPNELDFIRQAGGVIVRVNRGPQPVWYDIAVRANSGNLIAKSVMQQTYPTVHFSEWAWAGSKIDYEIDNNGTLDDLTSEINRIMQAIDQ